MSNELISRDKLLEAFRDFKDMDCPSGHTVTADYMIELAEDAPAVDAAPVRHGRWNEIEDNVTEHLMECSVCKEWIMHHHNYVSNYCPNCGAKMMVGDK